MPLALLVLSCLVPEEALATKIHGSVIYSASPDAKVGIYSFDTGDVSTFAPVAGGEGIMSHGGGVYAEGFYYSIDAQRSKLDVYDTDTWSVTSTMNVLKPTLDMTYDESDSKIYGCFVDQNAVLGVLNAETGSYESIGLMRIPPVALMADGKGALYCIGMDGGLYSVDKSNAAIQLIGYTDVYPQSAQSAIIDRTTGKCYWAASRDDYSSGLYEVDLTDGHATLLYDFPGGEEITGLFILPEAAPTAPSMPQGLKADFAEGQTTGTFTFTMPLKTVGGAALPESLLWTLLANDLEKTGTAAPGATVNVPLELQPGLYKFAVSVAASGEEGKKGILTCWVGHDMPVSPSELSVEKKSPTSVVLSWEASVAGEHGGYVDATAVRYDILRYPGEVAVATDYAQTTFEDNVSAPRLASYSYVVTAKANGMKSAGTTSTGVTMGPAKGIPFQDDFASTLSFNTFMTADANDDGLTWRHDVGAEKASYPGHDTGSADDWLITPPLALDAGYNYCVKFDVCVNSFTPYTVEALLGELPNIKDLSVKLVGPSDLTQPYRWQSLQANFHVAQSGDYYIGIHATGAPNSGALDLDNLSVEILGASSAPEAPTALAATAYGNGELGADITMTAPKKAINGVELSGTCTVELSRGGKLIHTFSDVKPGAALKYSDKEAAAGLNVYKAVSYNYDGVGESSVVDVWVGVDQPGAVTSLAVKEVEDGKVEISWSAPVAGVHGGYVDVSSLTYTVIRNDWKEIVSGTKAFKAVDVVNDYTGQAMVVYEVIASSEAGAGDSATSDCLIVGTPYQTPFRESFAGGRAESYPWTTLPMNVLMSWTPSPDDQFRSQDGDGGIIGTYVYEDTPMGSTLLSPKVKIADTVNPVLEFYLAHSAIDDELVVEIIADSEAAVEIKRIPLQSEALAWEKVQLPLNRFVGKSSVQLSLSCRAVGKEDHIYVDNVSIVDNVEHNLAARSLQCPVEIMAGVETKVEVSVANVGLASAEGYTVSLYSGAVRLGQAQGARIAAGESNPVEVSFVADAGYAPAIDLYGVVEYDADLNESNNTSEVVTVAMATVDYPAPSALHGMGTDTGVDLQWAAPDLSTVGLQYTKEDFEGFTSFTTTDFGDWKAVEGDPAHTESMLFCNSDREWILFPGDHEWADNMAFAVVDLSQLSNATPADGWSCVSGKKFLMTSYSSAPDNPTGSYVGDYLISPRLKGCAQEITVNAKSLDYDTYGLETIEILASSTNSELASFKVVDVVEDIPSEWTRYRFQLPEGTLYFAIYSKQTQTALFLDDISYIAADAENDVPDILGYNVYRDKLRQNAELLTALTFSDYVADLEKDYEYAVSAMYASGESALSAPLRINPASLDGVEAAAPFRVVTSRGMITVRNCEGMDVVLYTIEGKVLGRVAGSAAATFSVAPGFYVVSVDGQSVKVAVR